MKNIYIASNSVEADSVVNKLSQNGINASCRQKENFSVMAGNTEVEFEIFVDDWEADKAKKLLSKRIIHHQLDLKKGVVWQPYSVLFL
ncbi:MAG: putative signal transducing protein [Anaerobutyricum sp.]